MSERRRSSGVLFAVVVLALVVGALWAVAGRTVVEKLVTRLAMPLGIIWFGLLVFTLMAFRRRQGVLTFGLFVLLTAITVFGNGRVSGYLVEQIEQPFLDVDPFDAGQFDTIIVLGGGTQMAANGNAQVGPSGDRVILAARLYHRGQVERIICTGQRIKELDRTGVDQAEQSARILVDLGVPADRIEKLGGINTSAEMESLSERFGDGGAAAGQRVGLITSAWHLPRALRLARARGLEFEPLPANFRTGMQNDDRPMQVGEIALSAVPDVGALEGVAAATKEWLAGLVGR